jgi:hypothetical protein
MINVSFRKVMILLKKERQEGQTLLRRRREEQAGQILLIVVLTMIVALTVGLSIAARIVTELKLSKQNEESQRAFQAAESGIQQTLLRQNPIQEGNFEENKASFSTTFQSDIGTSLVLNNGLDVDQDSGADVWLSDYSADSAKLYLNPMGGGTGSVGITLYWGSPTQTTCQKGDGDKIAPAIEVVLLKGPLSTPTIEKSVYEVPCAAPATPRISNSIIGTSGVPADVPKVGGPRFQYFAPLKFNGADVKNGLIMKIIPIFNSSIVGLKSTNGTTTFPSQGSVVESTGTSGDTVRKVVYYQSYPQMPLEVFPYSLISQ